MRIGGRCDSVGGGILFEVIRSQRWLSSLGTRGGMRGRCCIGSDRLDLDLWVGHLSSLPSRREREARFQCPSYEN
jgi:hypothetical protein